MENNNQKKIVNAAKSLMQNNGFTQTQKPGNNGFYSKKYYTIFFSIMLVTFLVVFWLCNYTKLKEMFQIMALLAFSIALAEYLTRRYLNL